MANRTSYEGETQRLPDYSPPPEPTSTARFDEALTAPAPAAQYTGPRRGWAAPLAGLLALALGVSMLGNAGVVPISGGFIEHTVSFDQRYDVRELALDVGSGNVTLQRAAGDQVEVEAVSHGYGWTNRAAERAAERIAPEIVQAGTTLRIEQDGFDAINLLGRQPYVEYRIGVPEGVSASLSTGSGNLEVSGVAGPLDLHTGSGNIVLRDGQGELSAETGSGNINVDGVSGRLEASTGSGEIEIAGAENAAIDLQTGSGNIRFEGSLPAEGSNQVSAGSGNIRLELPESANVDLRASVGSGNISIDDTWGASVDEHSATAQLGSGGAELDLEASSGNITVEAD